MGFLLFPPKRGPCTHRTYYTPHKRNFKKDHSSLEAAICLAEQEAAEPYEARVLNPEWDSFSLGPNPKHCIVSVPQILKAQI